MGAKELRTFMNRVRKQGGIRAGRALGAACVALVALAAMPRASESESSPLADKVLRFIREQYGVLDSVKMTLSAFAKSDFAEFESATLTVDDGKQPRTQSLSVSKGGQLLLLGNLFKLGADPKGDIVRDVRETFKVPAATEVTVGPFKSSSVPNFYSATVTATNGKQKQSQDFYVTKDYHLLVLGSVFRLDVDLRSEALRTISLQNVPYEGSASASVTIVEYADLQCPTCARLHAFLKDDLLPKYGNRVKVVFKEFPIVAIHEWALTGALANECAYQIDPKVFFPYRTLIFQHQNEINAINARDLLIEYGAQVGLDPMRLAGCIDSKASLPRIEESTREAQKLGINSTPTSFINGRRAVGTVPEAFYKEVEEALREKTSRRPTTGHS